MNAINRIEQLAEDACEAAESTQEVLRCARELAEIALRTAPVDEMSRVRILRWDMLEAGRLAESTIFLVQHGVLRGDLRGYIDDADTAREDLDQAESLCRSRQAEIEELRREKQKLLQEQQSLRERCERLEAQIKRDSEVAAGLRGMIGLLAITQVTD